MNVSVNEKITKILNAMNEFRSKSGSSLLSQKNIVNSDLLRESQWKKVKYSLASLETTNKSVKENLNQLARNLQTSAVADISKFEQNPETFIKTNLVQLPFNETQYRRWYGITHQYKINRRVCYHLQQSFAEWYAKPNQYGQFLAQDRALREYITSFFGGYHQFRITVGDVFIARSRGKIFLSGSYFKSKFDKWQQFFRSRNTRVIPARRKWLRAIRRHIGQAYLRDKSTTVAWYNVLQWLQTQYPSRRFLNFDSSKEAALKLHTAKLNSTQNMKIAKLRQEFSILGRMVESEYNLIREENGALDTAKWLPWGWQSLRPNQGWLSHTKSINNANVRKNRIRMMQRRLQFAVRLPILLKKTPGISKYLSLKRPHKVIKTRYNEVPKQLSYGFVSRHLNKALDSVKTVQKLKQCVNQELEMFELHSPVTGLGVYCSPLVSNPHVLRNLLKKYWRAMTAKKPYGWNAKAGVDVLLQQHWIVSKLEQAFDFARFNLAFNRLHRLTQTIAHVKLPSLGVLRRAGNFVQLQNNVVTPKYFSIVSSLFTRLERYAKASQFRLYPRIQYEDSPALHLEQLYRHLEYMTGCQVFINMVSLRGGLKPSHVFQTNSSMYPLYRIFQDQFNGLIDQPGRLIWMEAAPAIILASHKDVTLLLKLIVRSFKLTNYRHYNRFFALVKRYMTSVMSCLGKQTGFQGFKLLVNGKLKRNPRSVEERILIGRMPLRTADSRIVHSWQSVRRKRGVFGFKLWLYFGKRRSVAVDKRKQFLSNQQRTQIPPQNRLNAISWEYVNRHMQAPFWDSICSIKNTSNRK
jgi:ribosomal protein S3